MAICVMVKKAHRVGRQQEKERSRVRVASCMREHTHLAAAVRARQRRGQLRARVRGHAEGRRVRDEHRQAHHQARHVHRLHDVRRGGAQQRALEAALAAGADDEEVRPHAARFHKLFHRLRGRQPLQLPVLAVLERLQAGAHLLGQPAGLVRAHGLPHVERHPAGGRADARVDDDDAVVALQHVRVREAPPASERAACIASAGVRLLCACARVWCERAARAASEVFASQPFFARARESV
jgi:hypothetical protein